MKRVCAERRSERRPAARAACRLGMLVCLGVLMVCGCLVGPDYRPPESRPPAGWVGPTEGTSLAASSQAELAQWWTTFHDATLTSLVDRAVRSNLNLKQAEARIRQARAARGVVGAGLWPTLDASASYTRSGSGGGAGSGPGSSAFSDDLFLAGLDAAWELDLFGGVRRDLEAAEADLGVGIEDYRDTLVSLAAEVALNYVELRGFQQEIVIARDNFEAQQHTADLTRARFRVGLVGALDVANAEAQVATTASQIPVLETSARQSIYNLSVLLALDPSGLLAELSAPAGIPENPPEVPFLLPSDLLRRRPDIRRAESQIHAATARIGVATADLFPKVNLVGSGGFQGNRLSDWFNGSHGVWSVGPGVDWQIFAGGRILSNIEVQKALQEETVLAYQQTVLTAFQDVEKALIAYAKEHERRQALVTAVAANRKAVALATELYTQGLTDFLNVLDAERSLYASEEALVVSTRNLSTDMVALYKALGGGWEGQEPAGLQPASQADKRQGQDPAR